MRLNQAVEARAMKDLPRCTNNKPAPIGSLVDDAVNQIKQKSEKLKTERLTNKR